jgi:hypothetical protein
MWTVARVELVKGPALKIISPEVISGERRRGDDPNTIGHLCGVPPQNSNHTGKRRSFARRRPGDEFPCSALKIPWGALQFLNFSVGMSIQRLLKRNGKFTEKQRGKLDEYFGDPGWFDVVYTKPIGLFGDIQSKAEDAEERLVEWYRERLGNAFGNVSSAYLIRNSHGGHLYVLIFAGPNQTGAKIANDILRSGDRI